MYSLAKILGKKGYIRGPFGSSLLRREMLEEGIPVYEQQNAINDNRNFRYFVSESKSAELERFKVKPGDILVSCSGTVGKISMIRENDPIGIISQALLILRPKRELIEPSFLKFFLQSTDGQNKLVSRSHGSVQVNIAKRSDVESITLPSFSVDYQRSIVDILSSLDDKIEVNNKINSNLEELAQTLYKRWFVDFEFPNEEGKPYKSSRGEMVESELGLIPKAWSIKKIEEVCETVLGGTPSRKESDYWGGEINWINSGKVNDIRILEPSEMITSLGMEKSSTKLLPKKTTVIAITGATLGAVSLLEIDSCANQSVIGFLENSLVKHTFLFPTIRNHITQLIGRQTGGAQQHINKNDVNNYTIVMPDEETLTIFHEKTLSIYDQIAINLFEIQKLIEIRDLLLPKLMSGEIEV